VVTDSACSLPPALAAEAGVTVVPLWLTIGGHQYRDGDLELAEVLRRWPEGVSTAAPAPGELAAAAERADQGAGVVVLTVSRRMSAVFDAARLAAQLAPDRPVRVVDTRTAAGAQGLVVMAAADAARSGRSLADVVAAAETAAGATRLVATLPSLDHLARSGRVPGAAAWGARGLGLNPLFEFVDGRARPLRPARGRGPALARMVAMLRRSAEGTHAGRLRVAALHALEGGPAQAMLDQIVRELEPELALLAAFSPVMVVHTGPGLVGLAWSWH
jgi:fatty acid kinase fatty acid binding subunit